MDIEHLKKTVSKRIFNLNDAIWIEAFNIYNTETANKLGMKCSACYYKVLQFHEERDKRKRE